MKEMFEKNHLVELKDRMQSILCFYVYLLQSGRPVPGNEFVRVFFPFAPVLTAVAFGLELQFYWSESEMT